MSDHHTHNEAAVSIEELAAEIQADWARAQEAGRNAVNRAAYLASPECRREIDALHTEKAALERRLAEAKQKIAEMETIVSRFAAVQDPVVASDGYTYDRAQITAYVTECQQAGLPAVSQQNSQELATRFVPNNSLKRLIENLRPHLDQNAKTASPMMPTAVAPIG